MSRMVFLIAWLLVPYVGVAQGEQKLAESILSILYERTGNFQVPKPAVRIIESEELVAAYHPKKNTIFIERKAIEVTKTFGKDSTSALAFLLGHELTHCFQEVGWATNFLAYDKNYKGSAGKERTADIQGAFCAALAGYNTLGLISPLIDRLYEAYDLKGVPLFGYPSMEDREATASSVEELVEDLWQVYQTGNYLTVMGDYAIAAKCYEHVLEYYLGREIYNNLGILFALQAMNFSGKNIDPFVYPFELSPESRLASVRDEGLTPAEKQTRTQLLSRSRGYLKKALELFPNFILAHVNLLALQVQEGNYLDVIRQYETGQIRLELKLKGASDKALADAKLVVGIAYALSSSFNPNHKKAAVQIFTDLKEHPNPAIQNMAKWNAKILAKDYAQLKTEVSCSLNRENATLVDNVTPLAYAQKRGKILKGEPRVEIYWETLDNSSVYVTRWRGKQLVIQRVLSADFVGPGNIQIGEPLEKVIKNLSDKSYLSLNAGEDYFLHFPACRIVILVDKNAGIKEWGYYFN